MQNIAGASSRTGIELLTLSRVEIGLRGPRQMRDLVFSKAEAPGLPSIFAAEPAGGRAIAIAGEGGA